MGLSILPRLLFCAANLVNGGAPTITGPAAHVQVTDPVLLADTIHRRFVAKNKIPTLWSLQTDSPQVQSTKVVFVHMPEEDDTVELGVVCLVGLAALAYLVNFCARYPD